MTRPTSPLLLFATALVLLSLGGCILSAPTLAPLHHDLSAALPSAAIHPEVQVHLGRLSLGLTRSILRATDEEDDETLRLLRHVSGVEVAVYSVDGLRDDQRSRWSQRVAELGARRGWQTALRFQDGGETGAVLYQQKGEVIKSVYLFSLDDDELVIARFRGRLDHLLTEALAEHSREITAELAGRESHPATPEPTAEEIQPAPASSHAP